MRRFLTGPRLLGALLAAAALVAVPGALATHGADVLVSNGSPTTPFSQNKQNEPALAVNANAPNILVAGANEEIDPAVAFGPRRGANGKFSWTAGSRLYYANLTHNVGATRSEQTFKGFEAIAVSRTDNVAAAAANSASAWTDPLIISQQSSTTFTDKEQIWADNAESSPFFGNVYVCWAEFRSNSHGPAFPVPLLPSRVTVATRGRPTRSRAQPTTR